MLSPDSMVHPESPLRAGDPKGVKFWIGALPSGESRLLFSSAQIEYIRYYLHALGFLSDLSQLPLPNSSYMLIPSPDLSVSPSHYDDAAVLRRAVRQIDKYNKKILKADPKLATVRKGFEKIRNAWSQKYGTWIAIDFEAWEMENSMITEFGWTMVKWDEQGNMGPVEDGHFIVKEYNAYRNGKYVPDEKQVCSFLPQQILQMNSPTTQALPIRHLRNTPQSNFQRANQDPPYHKRFCRTSLPDLPRRQNGPQILREHRRSALCRCAQHPRHAASERTVRGGYESDVCGT